MKRISVIISLITLILTPLSINAQSIQKDSNTQVTNKSKVEMYYFHYTRRCETCLAVEDVSKEAVKEIYGDKVKFSSYNLEETEGEKKGEEMGISGQTLIIISGDKKINLTNDGFMYARNKPEKLKKIIKENIDPLLKP